MLIFAQKSGKNTFASLLQFHVFWWKRALFRGTSCKNIMFHPSMSYISLICDLLDIMNSPILIFKIFPFCPCFTIPQPLFFNHGYGETRETAGQVLGLVLRPRFAGGAAGNGPMVFDQGRPLQVWEIAKQLTRGIAFAKRLAGEVPSCLRDVPSWSC